MIQPAIDSNASRDPSSAPIGEHRGPVASSRPAAPPELPLQERPGILPAIQSLIYIIVVAIFIITFCIQPFRIPSGSMEPTLLVGDFLLVNKQITTPRSSSLLLPASHIHRGEIIVFHYPVNPAMHLVKRVVGLPGDHLRLRNGRVYVNGKALVEPYAMYLPGPPDSYRDNFPHLQSADPDVNSRWWIQMHSLIDNGELIVPANSYFVLGDNRNDSEDSRYWGFVPRNSIVGEPLLIYFSLQQPAESDEAALSRPSSIAAMHLHHPGVVDILSGFARWDRTLQIVK